MIFALSFNETCEQGSRPRMPAERDGVKELFSFRGLLTSWSTASLILWMASVLIKRWVSSRSSMTNLSVALIDRISCLTAGSLWWNQGWAEWDQVSCSLVSLSLLWTNQVTRVPLIAFIAIRRTERKRRKSLTRLELQRRRCVILRSSKKKSHLPHTPFLEKPSKINRSRRKKFSKSSSLKEEGSQRGKVTSAYLNHPSN